MKLLPFLLLIVLLLLLLTEVFLCLRKKYLLRRIRSMLPSQKYARLNTLLQPFGFFYLPEKDIISSTHDAWQRSFGYEALFDETTLHFNMVFDCEPVYFDCSRRTWMIEFWKGQYGINIGAEIGVYYADSIVEPEKRRETHFYSVADSDMLPVELELSYKGKTLFSLQDTHWWLTGFDMGRFCQPEDLAMRTAITFPDCIMLQSFIGGLIEAGYALHDLSVSGCRISYIHEVSCGSPCDSSADNKDFFSDSDIHESSCICCRSHSAFTSGQASFTFTRPHSLQPRHLRPRLSAYKQKKNLLFCKLYLWGTNPLTSTCDRLLLLYYLLPPVLRRMLRFRKCKDQKIKQKIQKTKQK